MAVAAGVIAVEPFLTVVTRIDLAARCYPPGDPRERSRIMLDSTLDGRQREWSDKFRGILADVGFGGGPDSGYALGEEQSALLLVSTSGEFDPASLAGTVEVWRGTKTWSRDRLRRIDLRDQLRTDSVILIGFAGGPGPARLFRREGERDFRPLEPDPRKSLTMYRIRIPVTVQDRQAEPETETETESVTRVKQVREKPTR